MGQKPFSGFLLLRIQHKHLCSVVSWFKKIAYNLFCTDAVLCSYFFGCMCFPCKKLGKGLQ